ncbi:MAG: glutamate formiminotransferase, partial [Actinomycetota bacterium]|nr:glutamate formiminotransferase [Actinomycetota bacterium]
MLECVVNVSEGVDARKIRAIGDAADAALIDVHSDQFHNRSVLTLAGPPEVVVPAARRLSLAAIDLLDLRHHSGVHPRLGVVDVVP